MIINNASLFINAEEGLIQDKSGNEIELTPYGNAAATTAAKYFGDYGLQFDGTGDYIDGIVTDQLFLEHAGNFSYNFWIYATSSATDHIFDARNFSTNGMTIRLKNYKIEIFYGIGQGILLSSVAVQSNVFSFICVERVGSIVTIYINGVNSGSTSDWSGVTINQGITKFRIGAYWTAGYDFLGYLDDLLVLNYALWGDAFTPPSTGFVIYNKIYSEFVQKITNRITRQHQQKISMATRLFYSFQQIIQQARVLSLKHNQIFDTTIPLYIQHEQVFHGMAQVAIAFTQVFRGYGAQVAMEFIQAWASHDYNLAFLPFVQLIGAQLDTVLQEIQFSVTVAGARVGVTDCQFDRDDFCQIASLTLADKRDYDNKQVLDNVVITVYGEQFALIVVDKPYDEQIQQGRVEHGYLLECASVTCQLSEGINDTVRANRITASFPAGEMASVILAAITDGICSSSLNVTDFKTGGYDFEDIVRIDALRQVFPQDYGWIIETDGDGVLQISAFDMPDIDESEIKTLQFKEKQLTPPEGILYTQVSLKNYNQDGGQTGLTLEVVDNGDGTGKIYGYSVPWTDAFSIFNSDDSTVSSLLITGGTVEEIEVDDTNVEFVEYNASISKPCYSDPVIDWGDNDSLSPVIYTESGALSTMTEPGYSVAVKATWLTRRKVWTYDNRKIDVSQVRIKYNNE